MCGSPAAHAETYEVTMEGFSFFYDGMENMEIDLTIAPGDTVRWLWVEGFHNVVSGFPEGGNEGDLFFSGEPVDSPGTIFEFTFDVPPGVYGYHCHPHEAVGMISSVTVADEPVPAVSAWSLLILIFLLLTASTAAMLWRRRLAARW